MAYKVTGAAAVVEMDDGKPDLGTGTKLYFEEGVQLPDGVKKASLEHLLSVGLIGGTSAPTVSQEPAQTGEPTDVLAKSASRADWDAYAKAQGLTDEQIATYSSKEDLQKHFGVE